MSKSPFVPGARVAISDFHGENFREAFVAKVFKNGNFILRGSTQQWRPSSWSFGEEQLRWSASETGDRMRFSRRNLKIWDAATDAEITALRKSVAQKQRRRDLCERLARIPEDSLTDAMLAQIEAALPEKVK